MSFSTKRIFQDMRGMCDQEIRALFDDEPGMTVKRLAAITGKTVDQIKKILMETA